MRTLEELDREMEQARQALDRAGKLEAVLQDLQEQREQRRQAKEQAREVLSQEQEDVEELEKISLASFWARLKGEREERLEQERREALAAKARYDAAQRDLEDLERRLSSVGEERANLLAQRSRYQALLGEKEALLRQMGGDRAQDLMELEEQRHELERQLREIREAEAAGKDALYALREMSSALDHAADLGTWDMFGGGMFATMAKHDALDEAQQLADRARQSLSRFRTEMADVSAADVPDVEIGEFAALADYLFDGLFADCYIQGKIHDAQAGVNRSIWPVERLLNGLTGERERLEEETDRLERRREELLTAPSRLGP